MMVFLLVVVAIVIAYSATHSFFANSAPEAQPALVQLPVDAQPPITPTMQAVVDASVGFSAFVSYTDHGFEPELVNISEGQVIRFTNNSSRNLWVSAVAKNGVTYPAGGDSCGQSEFDSCVSMPPNEIWEFKFDTAGEWGYRNNIDQTHVGVVRVN